jgi:hypothetical protein
LRKKVENGGVRPVETFGLASLRVQDLRRKEQGMGGDIICLHMARYQRPGRLEAKLQWSKRRRPTQTLSLELKIREDTTNSFTTIRSQDGKDEKEDEEVN